MVLRTAGDIAVDMSVLLQSPGHAGGHQCLERSEHGGTTDPGITTSDVVVQLAGGDLPADGTEGVGHQQPLMRHPLAGITQSSGR